MTTMYYTILSSGNRKAGIGRSQRLKLRDFLVAQGFPLDFPLPQARSIWSKWLAEAMPPPVARALLSALPIGSFVLLDVYSGIGGWVLGAFWTGKLRKAYAIEIDKRKCVILRAMAEKYGIELETICADALGLDLRSLSRADIVVGSPPCEDISLASEMQKHFGKYRPKGTFRLTRRFFEIVDAVGPRYWLLENVYAKSYAEFLRELRGDIRFLRRVDFSRWVPQYRYRLIASNYSLFHVQIDRWL